MRLYTPRKLTAKHLRNGIELLECPDCGALIFSRMKHDAWHTTHGDGTGFIRDMFRVDL